MASYKYSDMAGVVLAGGLSQRMGRDKALVHLKDLPLITYPLRLLSDFFQEVIIVSNNREEHSSFGFPVFPDLLEARGALVGLYSGLKSIAAEKALFAACDMPFITPEVVELLVEESRSERWAVVPRGPDGIEPLLAIYSRKCIEPISRIIASGNLRISTLLEEVPTTFVSMEKIGKVDSDFSSFINLNKLTDLEILRKTEEEGIYG